MILGHTSPEHGTRWNNKQLLFHMLLGYLIVRALRGLVVTLDRLPPAVDMRFAQALNAVTMPFDAVNYAGAWLAGSVLPRRTLKPSHAALSLAWAARRSRASS